MVFIRTKTTLSVIIPLVVMLFIVAMIIFYTYEGEAQEIVKHRDTELARISANRLSQSLNYRFQVFQAITNRDDFQSMEPARLGSALEEAQSQLSVFDAGVIIYDNEGVALYSQPPDAAQKTDFPNSPEFAKARSTLRPVFSNVFKDILSGEDVIMSGVPIIGKDGEFKGLLAGMFTIRYSLLGTTYAEVLELKAGLSGYAYLVDGNGRVIYHRHSSKIGTNLTDTPPVIQVKMKKTGAVITEDHSTGELIISGFAPVPGTDWGVITHEKWENIFGPTRIYINLILSLLLLGIIITGVIIFLEINHILKPLNRLSEGAKRIAMGSFKRVTVPKSGDEIEILAQQFNIMVDGLKESSTNQKQYTGQLKEAYSSLKKRTEELEKFGKLSIGRELRMVDLKKKIKVLEDMLKKHGIKTEGEK